MKRPTERDIAYYTRDGYSRAQAKSMAWADFFEGREMVMGLGYKKSYDCYCRDCKVGHVFGAAGSIRTFISMHYGHNTRTVSY